MTRDPFDFGFLERFKIPLKRYDAGEKIFLEEDPGDHMYVVIEGKVNIVTYGSVLENVGMHGIFGEMALIDSAPRSAAAIAVEPTEVAIISKDTVSRSRAREPAILALCHAPLGEPHPPHEQEPVRRAT